jgi:hypothetical protein
MNRSLVWCMMYFVTSHVTNSCPFMVNRNATALFLFVRLPPYIAAAGDGGMYGGA